MAKRLALSKRPIYLGFVVTITFVVTMLALLFPVLNDLLETPLRINEVAPYEINAPYALTYESEMLTSREREVAAAAVAPVYSTPDPTIARQQLETLRTVLAYISNVRADVYASTEQKLTDLAAMENVVLDRDTSQAILALSDNRWQTVHQESIIVLEQVMRGTIRDEQMDGVIRDIPTLVNLSLSIDQANIVTELVTAFVVPNSLYNAELTEAVRQQASEAVPAVNVSYAANQNIVRRGQLISELGYEALQQFNLVTPTSNWQDIASATLLAVLSLVYAYLYLRCHPELIAGNIGMRNLGLIPAITVTRMKILNAVLGK